MSIFPTRIESATDGSGQAAPANRTAIDLARMSDSVVRYAHCPGLIVRS